MSILYSLSVCANSEYDTSGALAKNSRRRLPNRRRRERDWMGVGLGLNVHP